MPVKRTLDKKKIRQEVNQALVTLLVHSDTLSRESFDKGDKVEADQLRNFNHDIIDLHKVWNKIFKGHPDLYL